MQKENVKVVVKLACFPARFMAARRVGVSRFFVSDRWDNLRKKIGRCRIAAFRQNKSFCYNSHRGFTLIELLVVVLIIGILAAVALPQYQKAVIKSESAQALTLLKTVGNAVETYLMANGEMPSSFDELDIELPADFTGHVSCFSYHQADARSNGKWSIVLEKGSNLEDFNGIWMGYLTGKYRGAGFGIQVTIAGGAQKLREIVCTEYTDMFGLSQGDFCTKIFKTNTIVGNGGVVSFQLS